MPGLRAITHGAIETNAVSQMCIIPSCRQFSSLPNSAIPSSTSTPTWLKSIVLVLGGFAIGRSYTNQQNEERQHEKFPALSALVDFLRPLEASAQASASSSILYEPPNKRVGGTSTPLAGCLSPYFISDAAAKAAPAVVNILVQQDGVISGVGSRGSGFIVSSDGSVLTNAHVVIDALGGSSNGNSRRGWGRQQQQRHHHFPANKQGSTNKTNVSNSTNPSTNKFIAVTLQDGRTFEAEVINYDTVSDLAVLKLKEVNEPLPVAKLGVSAGLRVGEWVVALGSPLHLQNSVSAGIISCVERKASELGLTGARAEYIQTDASINRGSSGGPLVNLAGEVVGVSSMKALAADGVSFAIPIDSVREVVRQLEVYGRVIRPYIGVKLLQLNRYTASQLRKKDSHFPFVVAGVLVPQVASGSPAEKAGLKAGDIIVRYDGSGKEVTTSGFIKALEQHIGEELSIEVVRPDGKGDGGGRTINLKIVAEEATGHRVENGINRSSAFVAARPVAAGRASVAPVTSRPRFLVEAAKGKQRMRNSGSKLANGGMPEIPTPPVDPDNVEFVIFVRSAKLLQWMPLSVMKGGAAANLLVKSLENDLGKKLYGNTLIDNIGGAIYKDKDDIERTIKAQFPMFKATKEFEFGFKIRDKENPKNWYMPIDVQLIPPQSELGTSPLEEAGNFFSKMGENLGKSLGI